MSLVDGTRTQQSTKRITLITPMIGDNKVKDSRGGCGCLARFRYVVYRLIT